MIGRKQLAALARVFISVKKWLKWGSWAVNVLAATALVFWLCNIPIIANGSTFEQEPVLVGLTMLAAVLNQIHRWLLQEAEFSPAVALACGYVNNFLSPVITQLKENGNRSPIIYVYKPAAFRELTPNNVDRIKADICNQKFELDKVDLTLKHGRARDVMIIQKSKTKMVYFDLPNTLLSLVDYVDYKVGSRPDSSAEKAKEKLTKELIATFYERVDALLEQEGIQDNVQYCDKELKLAF